MVVGNCCKNLEGCRVPVRLRQSKLYHYAEILSIKKTESGFIYYVHFDDFNKRLDEWVEQSRIDFDKLEYPSKKLPRDSSSASLSVLSTADPNVRFSVAAEDCTENEHVSYQLYWGLTT
ncbi:Histone acetyltransferase KAT5 [Echinococcus granulosus]|nr:Histone acetyltransferase KAT5 [Echinococcus granulosus]